MQERIFCPLRGHAVGRMQYAPTTCRQETLYLINSQEEREETKMQEQKNRPLGSRGVLHTPHMNRVRTETKMQERRKQSIDSGAEWHTPHMDRVRIEKKKQERIFCPLRGHAVGRMQYVPTSCRQETLFPINSQEERIETKMQEQKSRPLGSRGVLHTPYTDRVRIKTKMQEQIFCPLWGHVVGRVQYPPTDCRQEMLFPINSREERIETKIQEQKNRPLGSRGVLHTPHTNRERIGTKKQDRIFCPLRGHAVGRMQYAPTSYRQETLFPINSQEERIETKIQDQKNHPLGYRGVLHTPHTNRVRIETKKQERRNQSIDSGAEWHTPFMRHGERDAVWREAFLEQRARVAVWRDRRLEERSSHARLQLRTSGENSKPYKSSLVALSEQLRDIFAV